MPHERLRSLDRRERENAAGVRAPDIAQADLRGLASAMGNQAFGRFLAREPQEELGPDKVNDPERCAVDVCAVDTAGGAKHLFVVYTNERGVQYGYRAGPDGGGASSSHGPASSRGSLGAFYSSYIECVHSLYTADTFPDYDLKALSVRALSGADAMGKGDHLAHELDFIDEAKVEYSVLGPNSNSVVSHLLITCGIPRVTPVASPVGWDTKLFGITAEERENGRGGAEGTSEEGPSGAGGASGW